MNLLEPLGLLGLAALVPVVALYFLKLKREERVVPSTLLWKRVIEDMQVNAPFQRLRYSLLLLLQLFLVTLAALALARPYLNIGGVSGRKLVLLIDTSASMTTRDGDKKGELTRLQAALRDAQGKIDDLRVGDEMALIAFDSETRQLSKFTSDRSILKQTLSLVEARDLETHADDAFETALNLTQGKANAEVLVLSDGCFDDVKLEKSKAQASTGNLEDLKTIDLPDRLKNFRFISYGNADSDNAGITQMDARTRTVRKKDAPDETETEIFVMVENFSPKDKTVVISLGTDTVQFPPKSIQLKGRPARVETLDPAQPSGDTVEASRSVEVFKLPQGISGAVTARIVSPKDKFAGDDTASVIIESSETLQVLLVTKGNFFLERALNAMRGITLVAKSPGEFQADFERKGSALTEGFDVCIFEGTAPLAWTDGGALFLGVMPPVTGFSRDEAPLKWPPIFDWDTGHPAMRYVNFGNVTISEAQSWKTPKAATPLVRSSGQDSPLVTAFQNDRLRVIGVAFDIFKTDWAYRPSLPLFLRNALPWLGQISPRKRPSAQKTGEPLTIPAGLADGSATLMKPDGSTEAVTLSKEHTTLVKGTDHIGLYQLRVIPGDPAPRIFAFNLSSRAESDNTARASVQAGTVSLANQPGAIEAKREIWRWIIAFAVLILLGEWWVYHRRIGL